MGKTPKPLKILVHLSMLDWPEIVALAEEMTSLVMVNLLVVTLALAISVATNLPLLSIVTKPLKKSTRLARGLF